MCLGNIVFLPLFSSAIGFFEIRYTAVQEFVGENRPDLLGCLPKNIGFGLGIDFREKALMLNGKNTNVIKRNMVFNLAVGFHKIENEDSKSETDKTYAVFLAETVLIGSKGAEVLTPAKKTYDDICFEFKGDDDDEEDSAEAAAEAEKKKKAAAVVASLDLGSRRRGGEAADEPGEASKLQKMESHQAELALELERDAKSRLLKQASARMKRAADADILSCYKRFDQMDAEKARGLKIYVDKTRGAVVFPIYGMPVPFHISYIKSVTGPNELDGSHSIKVNFDVPGVTLKPEYEVRGEGLVYLKELQYKSKQVSEMQEAVRKIKELQKRHREAEKDERERKGHIEQDELIKAKAGDKVIMLKDLYIKPSIVSRGKRAQGSLQAHRNGFLFTTKKGEKIRIMYNRIKHAIYQPPDEEVVILLHFHLTDGIMVNKKQVKDIQFYYEVDEVSTDLGKSKSSYDRDELEAEDRQRRLKKKLREQFKKFQQNVQAWTTRLNDENPAIPVIEFDQPVRELGFYGVPLRTTVLCQPTTHCLVNLTDSTPFVMSLEEVERVHFERVDFSLRNFDMVFIYKDYERPVTHINSVEIKQLSAIKEWLDSCDLKFTEKNVNMDWKKIMKTIIDDPEGFFELGGWKILEPEERDEDDEEDDDDESEGFDPGSELDEEESEDDYDSDEDASDEDDSDEEDDDDSDFEESEEEGLDWDELEEQAKRDDARKRKSGDDDDESPRRKKRKGPPPKKRR